MRVGFLARAPNISPSLTRRHSRAQRWRGPAHGRGLEGQHRHDAQGAPRLSRHSTFGSLRQLFVAAPLLWGLATSTIKLSILCFYTSIFPSRTFRHVVYAVMTVTVLQLLAIILRTFLLCTPFSFTWNKTVRGGSCGNRIQAYLPIAITNLIIDLTIVALPMKPLWGLKLPFKKKMVISAILFFGLV